MSILWLLLALPLSLAALGYLYEKLSEQEMPDDVLPRARWSMSPDASFT
jgi:hypothetical protein